MGDLDDAIREHLELKRKHGATEEEVLLKESEAQRQGALPSEPGTSVPGREPAAPPADTADDERPGVEAAVPDQTVEAALPVTEPADLLDELEPDEVLPEESLAAEAAPAGEPEDAGGPPVDWASRDLPEDAPDRQGEDVLEETPEFLEDLPEQDRLWFEQRPPKDFDFAD